MEYDRLQFAKLDPSDHGLLAAGIHGAEKCSEKPSAAPRNFFERRLFATLESRGFEYKTLNEIGAGTLHYHIESIEKNTNLRDWVPEWCFPFIFWAAGRVGGNVSARLDWFAGRGIEIAPGTKPQTIGDLVDADGNPLSDHDAIALDFVIPKS